MIEQEDNFACPYCGSQNSLSVDFTAGNRQEFVTDCETCCRPIIVKLTITGDNQIDIEAVPENA